MNRAARRKAAKTARKKGLSAEEAAHLDTALKAAQQAPELEVVLGKLKSVLQEFEEQQALLTALVDDYQNLSNELDTQREISLRLLAVLKAGLPGKDPPNHAYYGALQNLKDMEAQLRTSRAEEPKE